MLETVLVVMIAFAITTLGVIGIFTILFRDCPDLEDYHLSVDARSKTNLK